MLMLFSLVFYYWGEKDHIIIMLVCIAINFSAAIMIENQSNAKQRRVYLFMSIIYEKSSSDIYHERHDSDGSF